MFACRLVKLAFAAATLLGWSVAAHTRCRNPSVRREWRSMTPLERAEWINAVKCLNKLPHDPALVPTYNTTYSVIPPLNTSSSYFDDWVYVHMDLRPVVHFTGYFLPWHRAFVKDFETALRQKCNYTGTQPYWDWTLDASNFGNSTFWDPDTTSGVGGWGDPNDDYQVTDGGFATDFSVSYPSPHGPRRQYTPIARGGLSLAQLLTPASQMAMVNGFIGDFIGFQAFLESGSHGAVHQIVGGDLLGECPSNAPVGCVPGPKWSPNDPLFILHHGMIDKLWYDWQNANVANFWSFGGGAVSMTQNFPVDPTFPTGAPPYMNFSTPIQTDGILEQYTIYELMDTQDERLCYIYN